MNYMNYKKAVIFDMDGVLVDSESHQQKVIRDYFFNETNYDVNKLKLNKFIGSSGELEVWKLVFEEYDTSDDEFKRISEYLYKYMDEHRPEYKEILNDNAREIIKWLKEHGFKMGIASSSYKEEINRMLTETGLTNYFDYVLSGKSFKQSKPCPDIYNAMIDMLGVEKEKCLVIEDSYYGIQAAINANIDVVALKDNKLGINQSNCKTFINNLIEIKDL